LTDHDNTGRRDGRHTRAAVSVRGVVVVGRVGPWGDVCRTRPG
jgi:hypothetical protein